VVIHIEPTPPTNPTSPPPVQTARQAKEVPGRGQANLADEPDHNRGHGHHHKH
jgi:hypothetical protein